MTQTPGSAGLTELSRRIDEAFEAGAAGQGRTLLEQAMTESRGVPAYAEFFRAAAARWLAGDREEQGRRLQKALALAPRDPFLLRAFGNHLAGSGLYEDALQWYDRALEQDPEDAAALRRKGVSLSRLGRLEEALACFDAALAVDPRDAVSMRNMGVSLLKAGNNEEALAWFSRALAVNPRDHAAMRRQGVALANMGRLDEALAWYDKALAVSPGNAAALTDKARTLIEAGEYAAAAAAYDKLIVLHRDNPYHYLEKAVALGRLGRKEEAAEAVEQAYAVPRPSQTLRRDKTYWMRRLGLGGPAAAGRPEDAGARTSGGEHGDIARIMEKTWEVFRGDIAAFRTKIEQAKNSFSLFINSSSMFAKDRVFLLGARKWNSYTPSLPLGDTDETSVGGGYFLSANGVGTVIDPGFDFLENFSAMGGRLADIGNVVITHAHNDHTNDLESILTMFHQRHKHSAGSLSARLGRSRPRPKLNLYLNMGAFQKFSPMINLRHTDQLGVVRVIAPHEVYDLPGTGIRMRVLPAHHDEIFSTTYAVGLHFTLPTSPAKTVVFTGDTGLFPGGADITPENAEALEICSAYGLQPGEVDFFIPHLGSIGENELRSPDMQEGLGDSFYPNHLGVQGLIRLITRLRPKYVFVSEFGEELKGFIDLLMTLIGQCVTEVNAAAGVKEEDMPVILPMDLFFFCDLAREELYCAGTETFEPLRRVRSRHIDAGEISQFYYERAGREPPAGDPLFALRKLRHACRTGAGPFSDSANRTRRLRPGSRLPGR